MRSLALALLLVASPALAGRGPTISSALEHGLATRGVIGPFQARVAQKKLDLLPPAQSKRIAGLVSHAGSQAEAAFLLKAVAAGHSVDEVGQLADAIRGKPTRWLQRNLTAGDTLQSMTGTRQTFSMSCQSSATLTLVTEADPFYALKLHQLNPEMNKVDFDDAFRFSRDLAHREQQMLESTDPWGDHGVAVSRNEDGGVGRTPLDLLNHFSNVTQLRYEWTPRGDERDGKTRNVRHLVAQMTRALEDGQMVPIQVTNDRSSHIVLAMHTRVDRDAGVPVRLFQIHDPWKGNTSWVSQRELLADRLRMTSQSRLGGIHAPVPLD